MAADIDPFWLSQHLPPGDLAAPLGAPFLQLLGDQAGVGPGCLDLVLCGQGEGPDPDISLIPIESSNHPRTARARRYRKDHRMYQTEDEAAMLILGKGLAGRWEAAFEVEPASRNRGLGRQIVLAARRLIGPDEALFMQVASGNVASLRAVLAGGLLPIGAEVLFPAISTEL